MNHPFHAAIERHWREHRPRLVRQLEQEGRLDEAIRAAADRTVDSECALIQQGIPPIQAQELVREMWAFVAAEVENE